MDKTRFSIDNVEYILELAPGLTNSGLSTFAIFTRHGEWIASVHAMIGEIINQLVARLTDSVNVI